MVELFERLIDSPECEWSSNTGFVIRGLGGLGVPSGDTYKTRYGGFEFDIRCWTICCHYGEWEKGYSMKVTAMDTGTEELRWDRARKFTAPRLFEKLDQRMREKLLDETEARSGC